MACCITTRSCPTSVLLCRDLLLLLVSGKSRNIVVVAFIIHSKFDGDSPARQKPEISINLNIFNDRVLFSG